MTASRLNFAEMTHASPVQGLPPSVFRLRPGVRFLGSLVADFVLGVFIKRKNVLFRGNLDRGPRMRSGSMRSVGEDANGY
jgi:hypothetical protein